MHYQQGKRLVLLIKKELAQYTLAKKEELCTSF